MSAQRSIVIGGGALAGLALALALRQGLGTDIAVIVADPALATRPSRDPRATAIVAACRRLFDAIGVWNEVAAGAQPILDMVVTDSKLEDSTRPVFLTFAGDVEPGEPFAHMVENRHLIDALVQRAEAEGIDLRPAAVTTFDSRTDGVEVKLSEGSTIAASLLVAADGARRNCASAPYRDPWLGLRSIRHRGHGRHERDHHGAPKNISFPPGRSRSCRCRGSAPRWCGPKSAARRRASPRSARRNSTANSSSALGCISARSRRWTGRAHFHWAISSPAPLLASGWRWSATLRM